MDARNRTAPGVISSTGERPVNIDQAKVEHALSDAARQRSLADLYHALSNLVVFMTILVIALGVPLSIAAFQWAL